MSTEDKVILWQGEKQRIYEPELIYLSGGKIFCVWPSEIKNERGEWTEPPWTHAARLADLAMATYHILNLDHVVGG